MQPQIFNPEKAVFPCYVQPKLDGVRAVLHEGKFWSRTGSLLPVRIDRPTFHIPLDGELYLAGHTVTDISGAVQNPRNPLNSQLEFHVFDAIRPGNFEHRFLQLPTDLNLPFVPTYYVNCIVEFYKKYEEFIACGYEGLIYRNPSAMYKSGKTTSVMKLKQKFSDEFTIKAFDVNNIYGNLTIIFTLLTKEGKEFKSVATGSEEVLRGYLQRGVELIGKPATVEYFHLSHDDIPCQSNVVAIRDYE